MQNLTVGPESGQEAETHVGFLLAPLFSMQAFSSAIEPLRAVNRITGRNLYRWSVLSESDETVTASNNIAVASQAVISDDCLDFDLVIVCGGINIGHGFTSKTLNWLRRLSAHGVHLGAVSTGAEVLGCAGLLDGYRCTIHWENEQSFREKYIHANLTGYLFEIDRDRLTAAGGVASMDMMLNWILRVHGEDVAAAVAEQFIYNHIRAPSDFQRNAEDQLVRSRSLKLANAIRIMAENIEEPLAMADVAKKIDLSLRQLERLFQKHRGHSPHQYYTEMRLRRARQLVQQTSMSINEISIATGFRAHSHFSCCYRDLFGNTPSDERKRDNP